VTAVQTSTSTPVTLPARRGGPNTITVREDRWWVQPLVTFAVLFAFIVYSTWAAFQNKNYYVGAAMNRDLLSPFYSPCIAASCVPGSTHGLQLSWWSFSPALLILIVPLGFRLTCYYYRRSYYRAFWWSPPACAVQDHHTRYGGETRFPLILQNSHRYFLFLAVVLNVILTYDAVLAFQSPSGEWGHMGFGTVVLVVNASLLWLYSVSCHSCRHIIGGRLKHFSRHPIRFKAWGVVSKLNARHMQIAWVSLIMVALADLYVRLVASGWITDPRFF